MKLQTFIFFGPSGSGKGTQAKLLIDELKKRDDRQVLYLETGEKVRGFSAEASLTAKKTREIIDQGGLLPEFLPVWLWTEYLVRHVSGDEHMVLDGVSRRPHEAVILDSAMRFYNRENPVIISIDLSDEEAKKRMEGRGRSDDNKMDINKRLDWYRDNVVKSLEYFKNNPYYKFITIDGNGSIEEVHKEILERVGL